MQGACFRQGVLLRDTCFAPGQGCIRREGTSEAPQRRVDRRLEEAAKAVGGGYFWLPMPLRLALGVRGTLALGIGWGPCVWGGCPPASNASLTVAAFHGGGLVLGMDPPPPPKTCSANRKCTTHTRHRTRVRTRVPVGLPWSCCSCFSGIHVSPATGGGGGALPPVRWKLSFTVPCQEGSVARETSQTNGGCRLLPKRAKKHSIAVDCGELKATFGPRLRGTAKQQIKQ